MANHGFSVNKKANGASFNEKSALVVAHPDDEILWFSSVVAQVDTIIICFLDHHSQPKWTEGRRAALSRFPLKNVTCLKIPSAEVFDHANWKRPQESEFGLEILNNKIKSRKYQDNYHKIKDELEVKLQGFDKVFTHNPWGEYAHEEHVQLFRAVSALKNKLGYSLWFSSYFSNRSYQLLMENILRVESISDRLETNRLISKKIMNLYIETGCWTWFSNWNWPQTEVFFLDRNDESKKHHEFRLLPLQMVDVPPVNQIDTKENKITKYIAKIKKKVVRRYHFFL